MKKFMTKAVVIIATCISFTLSAHDNVKVVVIPLGGDEPQVQVAKPKKIFYTEGAYDGNLGGLDGADAICQDEADERSVQGTFKAWLGVTPASDLTPPRPGFAYFDLPYFNIDGTLVAFHFVDFLDGEFRGVIKSLTGKQGDSYITSIQDNGGFLPDNCLNWTSSFSSDQYTFGWSDGGITGDSNWSGAIVSPCSEHDRLLCFEQ